jgi:hypothetical protein
MLDSVGNAIGDTWESAASLFDFADDEVQTPVEKLQSHTKSGATDAARPAREFT